LPIIKLKYLNNLKVLNSHAARREQEFGTTEIRTKKFLAGDFLLFPMSVWYQVFEANCNEVTPRPRFALSHEPHEPYRTLTQEEFILISLSTQQEKEGVLDNEQSSRQICQKWSISLAGMSGSERHKEALGYTSRCTKLKQT
jgi:hypothetical protein